MASAHKERCSTELTSQNLKRVLLPPFRLLQALHATHDRCCVRLAVSSVLRLHCDCCIVSEVTDSRIPWPCPPREHEHERLCQPLLRPKHNKSWRQLSGCRVWSPRDRVKGQGDRAKLVMRMTDQRQSRHATGWPRSLAGLKLMRREQHMCTGPDG